MIVYHGSSLEIIKPKISYSKTYLDFGKGFYVTSFQNQAEKWALRKSIRQKMTGIVNVYNLQDDFKEYNVLSFESENEKWLDFVCVSDGELKSASTANLIPVDFLSDRAVISMTAHIYQSNHTLS